MRTFGIGVFGLLLVSFFIWPFGNVPSTRLALRTSFNPIISTTRLRLIRQTDSCFKTSGRTPNDGRWFNYTSAARQFYAYTAFYDDRPSLAQGKPVVRLIGFMSALNKGEMPNLRCRRHYADGRWTVAGVDDDIMRLSHNGENLNGERVQEYIITCPLELSGEVPLTIAVLTDAVNGTQLDDEEVPCTPVEWPLKPAVVRDFAVCMQVAYGRVDVHRMIEWLEMQRLLGVSMIGVYELSGSVHSLASESLAVLQHYAAEGFVELRKTDYIPDGAKQYMLHGLPVINDCIYRNMYRFRHIAIIDFDEVIMPIYHKTLTDLVTHLKVTFSTHKNPPDNYIFRNQHFYLESPPDPEIPSHFTILRYRWKVPVEGTGVRLKTIIDPQACCSMHYHWCRRVTPGYEKNGRGEVINPEVGVKYHHKKCNRGPSECAKRLNQTLLDDTILRFRDPLRQLFDVKVKAIVD